MKKGIQAFILGLAVVLSIGFFGLSEVRAQTREQPATQEAIIYYVSGITVNSDNSADVTEVITYDTGSQERHGIFRDIRPFSSEGREMSIEEISVVNEIGEPYQYTISNGGENVRIKIGDPNKTFSGQKVYIIRYHATRAVAQLQNIDEIYWNVTGNEWNMPIYSAQVSVILPQGAKTVQTACYFGPKGSTNKCDLESENDGIYSFRAPSQLNSQEGLTVAVGFPKGIVTPYLSSEGVPNFFDKYWRWFVAALFPILTFIFSLYHWYKKGRDARGTGVIIPQYDIPDNLTPMEISGIVNEKIKTSQISAEIIYLATKGYLKINQLEERFIGLIKSTDYELTKLKDFSDLPNDFDQKLMRGLFDSESQKSIDFSNLKTVISKNAPPVISSVFNSLTKIGVSTGANSQNTDQSGLQTIKISDLKYVFYSIIPTIMISVLDALLNKGYYKNLGRIKTFGSRIFFIIFMSIWASGFFGTLIGVFIFRGNPFPFISGIFLSVIIYGIISHFSPAKTEKGIVAKEYILGLKNYLQIAEKDRLQFHNAPEKRPEVFEKLLPYAMVLGVANIWAKEFEGIYTTPPSWYSGSIGAEFSAIAFSHTVSNFSSFASSSLGSAPGGGSGGSGGGGSSGGGGGGGGGGGW